MTNACFSGIRSIHHGRLVMLPRRRKFQTQFFRSFSTAAAPLFSAGVSIFHHRLPLVHASITQSDAPQRSDEWFALRKDKLTTSTFSTALGMWKGKRRYELWHEKVFASDVRSAEDGKNSAMQWGVLNEATAIERYKSITCRDVSSLGFAMHAEQKFDWIGASPDGLLGCSPGGGILEVKCPYNKGKPELGQPWSTMPFYYMPQVQGQMEIMDRDWADLYCWTPKGSTIFRVNRDREYWHMLHEMLHEFWWENVIPARKALLMGQEKEANMYEPASTHKQTGMVIFKSIRLAEASKLLCRETAGHVEFSYQILWVRGKEEMDVFKSEGSSWADVWDPEPLPNEQQGKTDSGKDKSLKKKLSFQWVKKLVKKSDKNPKE